MLSKLPPRERQIVDILYQRGPLPSPISATPCPTSSADRLSARCSSGSRTRAIVTRSESDRGFLYSPVGVGHLAKKSALSEIVRVFFNGSPASAASALLGMSDRLKEDELSELEQMIARARKDKGGK